MFLPLFLGCLLLTTEILSKPFVVVINPYTYQISPSSSSEGIKFLKKKRALQISDFIDPEYENFEEIAEQLIAQNLLKPVDITTVKGHSYKFENALVTVPSKFSAPISKVELNNSVLQITDQCTFIGSIAGLFIKKITLKKRPGLTYGTIVGKINFQNPSVLRSVLNHQGLAVVGLDVIIEFDLNPIIDQAAFSQLKASLSNGTFIKRLAEGHISWNDTIICTQDMILGSTRFSVDDTDEEFIEAVMQLDPDATIQTI